MRKETLKHIGEVRLMNCGQLAKVIGWDEGKPIIKFEDGTIVEDKRYEDYKKGSVLNPKVRDLTGFTKYSFEVISPVGRSDKYRSRLWYCRCSCGRIVELSQAQLKGTRWCPKSCGVCNKD